MESFLINITSFPTAVYSTCLVVVIGYWLLVFIGTFDIDAFEADVDMDIDGDIGDVSDIGGIAGLLTTLGLTGVPITVVISLLALNAWIVCYFFGLLALSFPQWGSWIHIAIGIVIAILSFILSIFISAFMIKPLRRFFRKVHQAPLSTSLLGVTCRIRSSRVDAHFGEAECQRDGASLIIKVRAIGDETFSTGDNAVIIEHDKTNNYFNIVSEAKFKHGI